MLTSHSKIGSPADRVELCDYVAQLQLHMTLQARNLVPSLGSAASGSAPDSRLQMLQQTQADLEKSASRLWL